MPELFVKFDPLSFFIYYQVVVIVTTRSLMDTLMIMRREKKKCKDSCRDTIVGGISINLKWSRLFWFAF